LLNSELIQSLMFIYLGKAGPKIIDYLLDHGAATNYVLSIKTGYQKKTIQHNLETLESLGFAEMKEKILDKRLRRRGPKTNVWMLKGASPRACVLAILEHMRLKSPEQAKRIEAEEAAQIEAERLKAEAATEKQRQSLEFEESCRFKFTAFAETLTLKTITYSCIDEYLKHLGIPLRNRLPIQERWVTYLQEQGYKVVVRLP